MTDSYVAGSCSWVDYYEK